MAAAWSFIAQGHEVRTNQCGSVAQDLTNPIAWGLMPWGCSLKNHMGSIHTRVFLNTEVPVDECTNSSHVGWLLVSVSEPLKKCSCYYYCVHIFNRCVSYVITVVNTEITLI